MRTQLRPQPGDVGLELACAARGDAPHADKGRLEGGGLPDGLRKVDADAEPGKNVQQARPQRVEGVDLFCQRIRFAADPAERGAGLVVGINADARRHVGHQCFSRFQSSSCVRSMSATPFSVSASIVMPSARATAKTAG